MTRRQNSFIGVFAIAAILMILCQVVDFVPGADSQFYIVIAALAAIGLMGQGWGLKGGSALLLLLALISSFRAHHRGIEYQEWLAKKNLQTKSQASTPKELETR